MERRIVASHKDFPQFNELVEMIHVATNPHVHRIEIDVGLPEQQAIVQTLKNEMGTLMNDVSPRDNAWILQVESTLYAKT